MATPAPGANGKRPHSESATRVSEVIEISSSDEEFPRPSKRQKSTTPIINGHKSTIKIETFADKQNAGPPVQSREKTLTRPQNNANNESFLFKPIPIEAVSSKKKRNHAKTKTIEKGSNGKVSEPSFKGLLQQSFSTSIPRSTPSQPPRLRDNPPSSAVPVQDTAKTDSDDADLKILENFKITDESSKQDRLRPTRAPIAHAVPSQPELSKRESTPKRSKVRVEVPLRTSPGPPLPNPKPIAKPPPSHVPTLPSATSSRSSSKSVSSPSYQFVPSTSQSSLFQLVVPLSQDALASNRPSTGPIPYKIDHEKERKQLLADLRKSTEPIKTRLGEIEKYFGQNGFSQAFSTDQDKIRLDNAASPKKRKVQRDSIKLEWGERPSSAGISQSDKPNRTSTKLVHPSQQVKQLLTARFREPRFPPLTFANDINDRRLNGKFQFVDRYIYGAGVRVAPPSTNRGCVCLGACQPETCSCLSHRVGDPRFPTTQQVVTYQRRDDGLVVLSEEYMLNELTPSVSHYEISECNDICSCGPSCFNRVVTRGRTLPLEIFETRKCGFGVRSSVDIVRGQFIDLYLGEVLTQQEVERREMAREENASSYIYSLDWFTQQNCYHVDGENFGTAMRFVNHNCSPNARNFTVKTHKEDKHVYSLAFFAIKDIPAGTEICIDYSPQEDGKYFAPSVNDSAGSTAEEMGDEGEEEEGEEENDGRARCHCGAENCRKFLWRSPPRKRRKRKTMKHD